MTTDTGPIAPALAPLTHPGWRFLMSHPAHFMALGAGSGLSRIAPGTAGTLWAWAAFVILQPFMTDRAWALLIVLGTLIGWWACTVTAQHMGQVVAFGLFRFFDAVKFGPMAWADQHFKGLGPRGGFGILLDDFAAAGCTLLVIAAWRF
jgi:phosphatidylglycerophosphatase A